MRFAANSHLGGARCGFAAAGCVANRQLLDDPRLSVAIDASVSLDQDGARTEYSVLFVLSVLFMLGLGFEWW